MESEYNVYGDVICPLVSTRSSISHSFSVKPAVAAARSKG